MKLTGVIWTEGSWMLRKWILTGMEWSGKKEMQEWQWDYRQQIQDFSVNRVQSREAMTTCSSPLAWKIPWTEEPGGLQSVGSRRVRHDWATSLSFFTFLHWRRNGNPFQCSFVENPRDGGAWWASIYGVAQSQRQLKWLSSSSSSLLRVHWLRLSPPRKISLCINSST